VKLLQACSRPPGKIMTETDEQKVDGSTTSAVLGVSIIHSLLNLLSCVLCTKSIGYVSPYSFPV